MTRWARVGNSQKHKKLPEDATPWEDFWQNQNPEDANRNKVKSGRIEKKKLKQKKNFDLDKVKKAFDKPGNEDNSKFRKFQSEESDSNHTLAKNDINDHISTEFQGLTKKQLKKAKKMAKLQQLKPVEANDTHNNNTSNTEEIIKVSEDYLNTEFQGLSKKQLKKAKKRAKLQHSNAEVNNVEDDTFNKEDSLEVSKTDITSPKEKDFQGKKKLFMRKLEKKRKENGILLLPAKVERKLYIIKKRLREKGLPPAAIKDIARKERRKEELKFRAQCRGQGSMSTKPCFNCRQIGHLLAECPMPLGNTKQETGLCFKCGSAEHTSYKCPQKIEGYPLAKCFVCKEQGHISKDCPKNERGVYIKGGKCNLCGNVNHLKKDCPTLKKPIDQEADITAYTINAERSVDAEIIPIDDGKTDKVQFFKKGKKAKIVKF